MKRKAASTIAAQDKAERAAAKDAVEEEDNEEVEMEEEDEEEENDETEEQKVAREEKGWAASRLKEVKTMYMDGLKKLAEAKGVSAGKKDDMVKHIMKAETKERADKRAHEAKIREIVQKKSDEFEALPIADLKARANLKGRVSKTDCIQQLLKSWQDDDGVDKALAEEATNERRSELLSKDNIWLLKHCDKHNVDPYVLEVMVDRILEHETRHDKYAPPLQNNAAPVETVKKGGDLVEALLASEAGRKRDLELQKAKEAADMAKVKELNALGVDALKKLLAAKGIEVDGKKEDLVKAAFKLAKDEEAVETRKSELKAMGVKELKQLMAKHGLEASAKVPDMVSAMLKYEQRVQEEIRAYEGKVRDLTEHKKGEFDSMSLNELKSLLVAKGLKAGVGKADRVERLAEEAQKDGSIAKKVSQMTRVERKQSLLAMDKAAVLDLCHELEIDPLMKDVMVQRIMSYENDIADGFLEPELKKQRSKK